MVLLSDGDGVSVRSDRVAVRARGLEGDEVHVSPVHPVDLVEHRDEGLDGGQGLRRRAGGARHGRREASGLGLVVDEVDRVSR